MPSQDRASVKQTSLSIDFLIIGAGLSGLSCAAALRRVGHRVTVVESRASVKSNTTTGCRMPPNLSKIFYHWGIKKELQPIALKSGGIDLLLYESGERLGSHIWDENMLKETRGDFLFAHYEDLQQMLVDKVISLGGNVRFSCQVTSIDPEGRTATLASGETLSADVIIGADGVSGVCRQLVAEGEEEPQHLYNFYSALISKEDILKEESLKYLYQYDYVSKYTWFGDGRAVLAFPMGGEAKEFCLFLYGPPSDREGSWYETASREEFNKFLAAGEPRLRKLCQLAKDPVYVPVKKYAKLEDWVHESGRLLLIGEAAHPMQPGCIQQCAMAIEDGAVLAKLFSHLRSEDQIPSFLYAFQDLRQPHVEAIWNKELGDITYMTLPPSHPMAEGRNMVMRGKRDRGEDVLGGGDDEVTEWTEIKDIFGYDCEDEADNWWVEWGLLRERAKGTVLPCGFLPSLHVEKQVAASSL